MSTAHAVERAVSPESFENMYRADPDPWNYGRSTYERGKYARTVAALKRDRYTNAFEPACSIGELTAMLASRCDRLLAIDVSPTAVERARQRCAGLENVRIECRDLRAGPPHAQFDLIVLSEVGYYFDTQTLSTLVHHLGASLTSGGELIAVHWLGDSADHILHGDEVHAVLFGGLNFQHMHGERHPDFRLDAWMKP